MLCLPICGRALAVGEGLHALLTNPWACAPGPPKNWPGQGSKHGGCQGKGSKAERGKRGTWMRRLSSPLACEISACLALSYEAK